MIRFSKPKSWKEAKERLDTPWPILGHYLSEKEAFLIAISPLPILIILKVLGL